MAVTLDPTLLRGNAVLAALRLAWEERPRRYSDLFQNRALDRLSQHRTNDDEHAPPGTEDLLRCGAGCPGNLESVTGAIQCIRLALPRIVKLSNWAAREFDVSLEPDDGRRIFSKATPGDELCTWSGADVKIGDLAGPGGVSTRARAVTLDRKHRRTRKLDTTDRPLVAPEPYRERATISA